MSELFLLISSIIVVVVVVELFPEEIKHFLKMFLGFISRCHGGVLAHHLIFLCVLLSHK